jgi:serpin B
LNTNPKAVGIIIAVGIAAAGIVLYANADIRSSPAQIISQDETLQAIDDEMPATEGNSNDSDAANSNASAVIAANNQFALDFYSNVTQQESSSIFFSPWSMSAAFAIAYEGARGTTAEEIQSVFGFPADDSVRKSSFAAVQKDLNENDSNYTLNTANALWVKEGYQLSEDYVSTARQYYDSEVANVDFKGNEGVGQINKWIESKTNNKIKDLIPPGSTNAFTRLIITNAVYFNGTWSIEFDEADTSEEDFHVNANKTVTVPMMKLQNEFFNYVETDELQVLEMPYQGGKVSMLLLLPHNGIDNSSIEQSLTLDKLEQLSGELQNQTIDVNIPKFKLETDYTLYSMLADMGMPTPFNDGAADFSGITEQERLFIAAAVHKAFVDVNEKGTEAVAATGITMTVSSYQPIPVFRADRPFIFIIQDSETGNILFMGRVADPSMNK